MRVVPVRVRTTWLAVGLSVAVWGVLPGCTRDHYFRQADREAHCLIAEKSDDPRWAVPSDFTVMMDPRSRYYDPCNVVHPPMPPDDPAAHRFMHCVDCKKGWPCWHADGDRRNVENPAWRQRLGEYVELTDSGAVKLSLDSAVRLAHVNSPDYQDQMETLYLSALDVSTERFRLDVQFFGGNDTSFTHLGRLRSGHESNTLTTATDMQLRRRFATAGELLVGFANSFVWQFAGPDTNSTTSLLNFSLVQPLLRGAGQDVALEQLTIAERALLYNLRAFQRYRQGQFVRIAVGDQAVPGPQRRGGFFGGTGLTGFTGTGAGGFGGVGGATNYGRAGFGAAGAGGGGGGAGFAGGGAGQVGGFVGLLQQLQQIHNNEESLNSQFRALRLLEAHLQAGTIDLTQVDQFRQNIETERATLLQSRNALQNALDTYKTGTIGLPPDLLIDLDDTLIRQFQFIAPEMSNLQKRIGDFVEEFGGRPAEPDLEIVQQALEQVAQFRREAAEQFQAIQGDLKNLEDGAPRREQAMTPAERKPFANDVKRLGETAGELKQRFDQTETRLAQLRDQLTPDTRRQTADRVIELFTALGSVVDELSLVQARARTETVAVEHEELKPEDAIDIARANRLDWMNNRAALVDTWRLIAFNADALQSSLSVVFSGDMSTQGNNPVKFRAPTGTLRAGLQFDAPLTRLLERNNFRQVLIDYQRDRRRLIQFEDSIYQTVRQTLRDLEQLSVNLEIQRRAVAISIRRVDQTREVLNQPPPPPQPGQPAAQLGPTAALNLMTAMSDLRSSQNNFMSVWLNYYAARIRLMRELGTMQLDEHGMLIERSLENADRATAEEVPPPPAVPEQWFEQLGLDPPQAQPGTQSGPPTAEPPPPEAAEQPKSGSRRKFEPAEAPLP